MVNFLKLKIWALLTSFVAICTVYIFLVRKVTRKAEFNLIIPDARAEDVWSVMADFSNYADLNPELVSFHLMGEIHDKSRVTQEKPWMMMWNYTVSYTEFFENLPSYLTNFAIGKYSVYSNETSHIISSSHVTCIFAAWCLHTDAVDVFSPAGPRSADCQVRETIQFECPIFLLPLCHSEVKKQRSKVLQNLGNWQL